MVLITQILKSKHSHAQLAIGRGIMSLFHNYKSTIALMEGLELTKDSCRLQHTDIKVCPLCSKMSNIVNLTRIAEEGFGCSHLFPKPINSLCQAQVIITQLAHVANMISDSQRSTSQGKHISMLKSTNTSRDTTHRSGNIKEEDSSMNLKRCLVLHCSKSEKDFRTNQAAGNLHSQAVASSDLHSVEFDFLHQVLSFPLCIASNTNYISSVSGLDKKATKPWDNVLCALYILKRALEQHIHSQCHISIPYYPTHQARYVDHQETQVRQPQQYICNQYEQHFWNLNIFGQDKLCPDVLSFDHFSVDHLGSLYQLFVERWFEAMFLHSQRGLVVQSIIKHALEQDKQQIRVWVPAHSFAKYVVSSQGEVSNLSRFPRILAPAGKTRLSVRLCCDQTQNKSFYVHRLIVQSFNILCPGFEMATVVDGNWQNLCLSNLQATNMSDVMRSPIVRQKSAQSREKSTQFGIQQIEKVSGEVVAVFNSIASLAQHLGRTRKYAQTLLEHNGGCSSNYIYRIPGKDSKQDREYLKKNFIQEGWIHIPGFQGYIAHKSGFVANCLAGKILKSRLNYLGYHQIRIISCRDHQIRRITVHVSRLIALTFLDNPMYLPDVHHINGIKQDDRVENLEWVSRQQNTIYWQYSLSRVLKTAVVATCAYCKNYKHIFRNATVASQNLQLRRKTIYARLGKQHVFKGGLHLSRATHDDVVDHLQSGTSVLLDSKLIAQ